MSFNRPTLSDLIARVRGDIQTRLPGADAALRHSVLDVMARTEAGLASGLYGYLDWIARQILPDTADAEILARHASSWGIVRKAAQATQATATATGTNGVVIPAGTEMQRADGAIYVSTAAATISAGSAPVAIEASGAGSAGDVEVGTVLTLSSPIGGVNAQLTVASLDRTGTDEEDDSSLRSRLLSRMRQPPLGGSKDDYVAWALAQPGVTRAWPFENWMGLGTVGLAFVMDGREDIIPTEDDVDAIKAALDVLRPVTADLIVFAPDTLAVDIELQVFPDSLAVRAAITSELSDFFAREGEPGGTIYPSRASEAVSLSEGEFRHVLVSPAAPVTAAPGQIPILGEVTFS
jgi:uncharacterized phage protein gp47/JayE